MWHKVKRPVFSSLGMQEIIDRLIPTVKQEVRIPHAVKLSTVIQTLI